jgi:hypothetical protein
MPQYFAEYRDQHGAAVGRGEYFARDDEPAALMEASALLASARRNGSAVASVALFERTAVSDHGRSVAVVKP